MRGGESTTGIVGSSYHCSFKSLRGSTGLWSLMRLWLLISLGRPYPEMLTQKQLSAITDAPECEWPNLTAEDLKAAAYAQSGTCSFIDGPPAGAATAAGENVGSQVMGFQMPMLFPQGHQFMYLLMNEMSPPLHLLECNTNGERFILYLILYKIGFSCFPISCFHYRNSKAVHV